MSIIPVEMYTIECDNCNDTYQDEFSAWSDSSSAEEYATDSDWFRGEDNSEHEGKHYCDCCYDLDDNDELILNSDRKGIFQPVPESERNYISSYNLLNAKKEFKEPESNVEIGIVRVGKGYKEKGYYHKDFNEWYVKGKIESVCIKPNDIRFWFNLNQLES
jgi:hypothetical protein